MMASPSLSPLPARQRIEVLDVLRGFALAGICVVNVEFFNRPVVEAGEGIPPGLAGLDWLAAFLVNYLVTGKFWILFSLLFGMGFALMLERATAAGRPFLPAYLRRIAALAVFGLLHHILLWSGDILLSYAIGALVLLLALFARGKWLLAAILACFALSAVPELRLASALATPLVFAGLLALYLRDGAGGWRFPAAMLLPGILMLLAALILALGGRDGGIREVLLAAALLIALGLLAWRYGEPASARPLRAGAAIFVVCFGLLALDGGMRYVAPGAAALSAASATSEHGETASEAEARRLRHRERVRRSAEERQVLTQGSYGDAVAMRTRQLGERLRDEMGFGVVLVGVFLVGVWFVRAGVIANAHAHLPLFRRLAAFGIPFGLLLGLAGGLIATGRPSGVADKGYDFAHALLMLGALPASLGYVAAVVLLLHSRARAAVAFLAPFGRMALTHYLGQTLVLSLLFYGYGAGLWGMGRGAQVALALALCAVQVVFSHWWLARFSHGPVEWLWRALTYLKLPRRKLTRDE
ncbi:DUF418 domain-containing protein [Massilia sp. DD77]|uniref:DUF418 domain-containing protein n=1 Tax=Massilia sp. DD77 TaxID=3109349 RepID=UPI002FFF01BD